MRRSAAITRPAPANTAPIIHFTSPQLERGQAGFQLVFRHERGQVGFRRQLVRVHAEGIVLGRAAHGVRDGVGVSRVNAGRRQLTSDGVRVKHVIRLP